MAAFLRLSKALPCGAPVLLPGNNMLLMRVITATKSITFSSIAGTEYWK